MGDRAYDVVIIGAGSVGTPAALFLAQAGLDVLVLDRLPSVGQGSNKAAIGGIRATHSDPAKIRLAQRTIEILASWEETHGQDIEWRSGGYVFVAYTPREEKLLKDLLVVQHAYGLGIEWLDAKALLEIVPDLNPRGLIGGTYSPGDGHCSPLLACHAFYEEARRKGASFRFGEQVTGIELREGRVRAVRSNEGCYETPVVINARWGTSSGSIIPSSRTPTRVGSRSQWPTSSTQWSWTSGPRPDRPTTTSTSSPRGRSRSASPPSRRSWGRTAERRAGSSPWSPGGWWISCPDSPTCASGARGGACTR